MKSADDVHPHELARKLSDVARSLEAEPDEEWTLHGIVHSAVSAVPGVSSAGIIEVAGKRADPRVSTDELVRKCDEAQSELGDGPCLEAIREQDTIVVDDMSTESRWPRFATRASGLGVGSMISFQLYVTRDTLGALNLYGDTGVSFGEEARIIGELFASHAAVAMSGARTQRQLGEALDTRDVIGQAKGILMRRGNGTRPPGFRLCRESVV